MKPIVLAAVAASAVTTAAATPAAAAGAYCRLPAHHHHAYRHVVRRAAYPRSYAYSYATPAYYRYGDYGWRAPYYTRTYYDWSYAPAPAVWVDYDPDYGWYDGGWRWRHHRHWRGHWHGDGHWDHGWHRGWR